MNVHWLFLLALSLTLRLTKTYKYLKYFAFFNCRFPESSYVTLVQELKRSRPDFMLPYRMCASHPHCPLSCAYIAPSVPKNSKNSTTLCALWSRLTQSPDTQNSSFGEQEGFHTQRTCWIGRDYAVLLGGKSTPWEHRKLPEACELHLVMKVIIFNCEQLFCFVPMSIYIL